MNARIVYEDDALLVVDKPAGMPTQRTRAGEEGLYEALRRREPLALHHRLDRGASGLVLFARDPAVNRALTDAFRAHAIARTYRAVLDGAVATGRWAWPIDGKPARTDVIAVAHGGGATAAELALHHGRSHQIRRHAALAGHPVWGDRRYGAEVGQRSPRLLLHAWRLALDHPHTRARLELEAPLPADMIDAWLAASGRREG